MCPCFPAGGENFVALDLIVQHVHSQLEKVTIPNNTWTCLFSLTQLKVTVICGVSTLQSVEAFLWESAASAQAGTDKLAAVCSPRSSHPAVVNENRCEHSEPCPDQKSNRYIFTQFQMNLMTPARVRENGFSAAQDHFKQQSLELLVESVDTCEHDEKWLYNVKLGFVLNR